jgi:hypothetical protein
LHRLLAAVSGQFHALPMRAVAEYRAKADEFEALAQETITPALKRRYSDMAECYRLLAEERERLIKSGELPEK